MTFLGIRDLRPWDELRELAEDFDMEEMLLESYYICRGRRRQ